MRKEKEKYKMNTKRIASSGMIVVALLLAMLVMPVSAYDHDQTYDANAIYFVPEEFHLPGNCSSQNVGIWVNTSFQWAAGQLEINFTYCCANITNYYPNLTHFTFNDINYKPYGQFGTVRIGLGAKVFSEPGPGPVHIGDITVRCCNDSYCETAIEWWEYFDHTYVEDMEGNIIHLDTYADGTFSCGALPTFSKYLYAGWNLVSLPLVPRDNSTSSVLASVCQNVTDVYKYNATSKQFEVTDTMDPGEGYFVYVTENCEWNYTGESAYTSIDESLKHGLNMPGWLNCSMSITDALSSISGDYNYVARWNATSQRYEVYDPKAPAVFNDFDTMEPGEGYWIAAKKDCTLDKSCPG